MISPRFAFLLALASAGSCVLSHALLTEPIGTSSATQTATVTITTAGTLQTISVLTQGATGLDFNAASGGTCSVGHAYAVGNTCTVNYTFRPTRPWIRYGGIALADSSGDLLGNTYVTGTGTGPQPIFLGKDSELPLGSGFNYPQGVAVDGNGNVYVANVIGDNAVNEIVAVNGKIPANPVIRILGTNALGSDFGHPAAVAVDGSGNVFVADEYGIHEIVAVNGSIPAEPAVTLLGSIYSFLDPQGVAVDGSGNVYVADMGNSQIKEMVAVSGVVPATNPTINVLGSGFDFPVGVAVDGSGNVFVADAGNGAVKEILAVEGVIPANPVILTLSSSFVVVPFGVAVDGAGNVYFTNNSINEIAAVNGSIPANPTINVLGSGFNYGDGVAVDGRGDVFVADSVNSRVVELNLADPPSLNFASTLVGKTSSDSPQAVTVENFGNATLTGALSVSANWEQVAGTGTPADCTASFSLAQGSECNLSISFEPTVGGALTGAATLADNALNVAGASQQIPLSGIGQDGQLSVSATALAFGNLAFGQQKDMSLQATNTGNVPVTFAPVISGPSFIVPPSGNGCGTVIPIGHSCSFSVRYQPETYGGHVDLLTLTDPEVNAPTVRLTAETIGVGPATGLLVFGTIPYGTTAVLPLTIADYGVAGTATLSTAINGPSFKVLTSGNTCLSGVASGQECTLPIEFSPAAVGGHGDVLTITPSSGAASTVKLYGIASQP